MKPLNASKLQPNNPQTSLMHKIKSGMMSKMHLASLAENHPKQDIRKMAAMMLKKMNAGMME